MDKVDQDAIRQHIPALERLVYMNTGTSGPSPRSVVEAQVDVATRHAYTGPADRAVLREAGEILAAARTRAAALFRAQEEEVCLTQNTSDGLATVAAGFDWKPGDHVVLSDLEHVSGVVPWLHYQERFGIEMTIVNSEDGRLDPARIEAAVTSKTRLICMSHVSYANGVQLPIREVSGMAEEEGIIVLVDGAQSAGQMKLDMKDLGCHAYAIPGQKWLLGPEGTGALFVREDVLDRVHVAKLAWASLDSFAMTERTYRLHPSARRYEIATASASLFAGFNAAVDFLADIGWEWVQSQIGARALRLKQALSDIPKVHVLTPSNPDETSGLVLFNVDGIDPKDLTKSLLAQDGILVRWIPQPFYGVRASVHVFNTDAEVDRLAAAVRRRCETS